MAAWRVFYSYSHKDCASRDRLSTYLAPLRQQGKIVEWYDRQIEPGGDWERNISEKLDSADLVLLLVSEDFLASEYCFGVEVERALVRLKAGSAKVVPILLRPCLWQESRFSVLQIIPRDARAITSWTSVEEAFADVAAEIRSLVSQTPPEASKEPSGPAAGREFQTSLDLVRDQVRAYARLYERTRQRMRASDERTVRMEQIFAQMRTLATASYPLLEELVESPSPGERLGAIAILQVFASERHLDFLVKMIESEKPFVGYHAVVALRFAVGALDSPAYPHLVATLDRAQAALDAAEAGMDSGRRALLREAYQLLHSSIDSLAAPELRRR